jgi:hypothetical protein
VAKIKTNEDIPAPPRGSRSMRGPARERLQKYKNKERIKFEKTYEFNKPKKSSGQGTGKVVADRAAKAGGRAQPKGTAPRTAVPRTPTALPPRTGPSSGGSSSLYSRLTGGGGLSRHGR